MICAIQTTSDLNGMVKEMGPFKIQISDSSLKGVIRFDFEEIIQPIFPVDHSIHLLGNKITFKPITVKPINVQVKTVSK